MFRIAVLSLLLSLLLPASGPIALLVELVSPGRPLHTNDVVTVRAAVAWGNPDRVDLFLDGELLTSLDAPYRYLWDTGPVEEGRHELQVRATLAGHVFASVVRSVTVDRTPPTPLLQTPPPGSDNIFIGDPAEVVFSEPIRVSGVGDGGAHVRDGIGLPVAVRVELSDDGTTLRLLPSENLALPNTLTATLDPQITDLAGNSVALPWEVWTWEVPEFQNAASLSQRGSLPQIAFDPDGRLLVAWIECATYPCGLEVRRGFGATLEPLGSVPFAGEVLDVALSVDARGRPLLAWREEVIWGHHLVVARWDGAWQRLGEPELLPVEVGELGLDLAVGDDDLPVVVWQQRRPGDGLHVLVAKRWGGLAWNRLGWELNVDPGQNARDPALTIDASGAPVVVWQESTPMALSSIRVSRWSGGAWRPLGGALNRHPDPAAASYGSSVDIVATHDGGMVVAWHEDSPNGIVDDVQVARWDGQAWRYLPSVDDSDDSSLHPALALDAAGRPVVAWEEIGGITAKLRVARWTDRGWELLGGDLNLDGGLSAFDPSVALDAAGRPHIVWKEGGSRPGSIYLKRHNVLPQEAAER
jgi:hypothetical protein